ncbi:hypothetical protein ACQ4PT_031312 [Festuca glaucescens]
MLGLRGAPPATAALPPRARSNAPEKAGRASLMAVPTAVSLSLVLWSSPVNAGILSGSTGLESVPAPELPRLEFLDKWNAENQRKYAENDSRSPSRTKRRTRGRSRTSTACGARSGESGTAPPWG